MGARRTCQEQEVNTSFRLEATETLPSARRAAGRNHIWLLNSSLRRHRYCAIFLINRLIGLLGLGLPWRFASETVFVNIAFYGLIFVQQMNGWSPFAAGLAFVPMMAIVLPANLAAPRLSERIGAPAVIAVGASVAAVGAFALLFLARGTNYGVIVLQLLALGGGIGLLVPPMTAMMLGSVDRAHSGVASGLHNSARQSGNVVGVALFGAFVARENAFLSGLRLSLVAAAALFILPRLWRH